MLDSTSLIVTTDRSLVALLREHLRRQKVAESRMIVSESADEACSLLQTVRARVVVVHLHPEHEAYEEVDHILWVASTLDRRVPVLVVAERYLVEQATMLYRMGVSDYVSRSHHLDQLGAVVASYLPHVAAAAPGSEAGLPAEKPARVAASGKSSAAIPARAV
jgi:DNA-binding NtrC family response regulator